MTWNEKQPHGVLSNMWQCQEQKLRGAAKPGLQNDYSEWQNPNTRLRFSVPKPCVSSAVPLAPCRVPPKSTTTTEELNSACQVRLESSIIRNKLKKISWGDTWCCPCVIKRSHHMVLQAEETRVMRRQGHEQKRQYPEQTTQNPSVCCLLESTWEIAFCNVSFSCFLPSKWSFSSRIPAAGRAAPSPLCPGCSFWPLLLPDVQGQVKWWLIHSLVHLPSSLRLFPSKDLSFIPRTLPLHSFIHRFLARLNEAPQNPAVTSSALQRCPVPGEGKKKKIAFHLFQNILGLFCGRPAASCVMRRREASFLAQPLGEGAVLGSQTSSLPFCVCFFVLLSISGEPWVMHSLQGGWTGLNYISWYVLLANNF